MNTEDKHLCQSEEKELDRIDFQWEGITLPCHSYYDVLATVLSILGQATTGATRHNYHLALLIILARFFIVVAGDRAKVIAPNLVSIMFTDEAIDEDDLNVIMGATIPMYKKLKNAIREKRCDFLVKEGGFTLRDMSASGCNWLYGQCAETFALVLLKR